MEALRKTDAGSTPRENLHGTASAAEIKLNPRLTCPDVLAGIRLPHSSPLRIKIILLLIFTRILVYSQDNGPGIQSIVGEYRNLLNSYMLADTMTSLSYVVLIDGKIVLEEAIGYADYENKIPADTNTLYRIGSITKPITAFLMMQMIEKGYFKLDDKIEDYLPEIKNLTGYSDSTKITFRQLVTHTSGLPFEPGLKDAALGPVEFWEEKLLAAIPVTSLQSRPGEKVRYSNFGFGILGLAISRAAGKPFMELVQKNIFDPLKMTNTFFILPDDKSGQLAAGIMKSSFAKYKDLPEIERKGRGYKVPVGGIYSNPKDYAKFVQALMGVSEPKILSDAECDLMKEKKLGIWSTTISKDFILLGHYGTNAGYTTAFVFDKKYKNGVVLMRNFFPDYGYRKYTKDFLELLNLASEKLQDPRCVQTP